MTIKQTYSPYPDENGVRHAPPGSKPMTDKLYGLDDIPEGWEVCYRLQIEDHLFECELTNLKRGDECVIETGHTSELALHKAIQKAKGEI